MAEEDQNTFVGSVIFIYKLYSLCGTDIFHFPTRHLLLSPFSPLIGFKYEGHYSLHFMFHCIIFFYSQMPDQAPEKENRLTVK